MKLNNYQKILYAWAVLLLVGYVMSIWTFAYPALFFAKWAVIILVGFAVQLRLGGFKRKSTKLIQILWIFIILAGLLFNMLEVYGVIHVPSGMNPLVGWPISIALVYLLITAIYRINLSYLLLAVLYALVGLVVVMLTDFTSGLIVLGGSFAVLCSLDALLENSLLRKKSLLHTKPAKK